MSVKSQSQTRELRGNNFCPHPHPMPRLLSPTLPIQQLLKFHPHLIPQKLSPSYPLPVVTVPFTALPYPIADSLAQIAQKY